MAFTGNNPPSQIAISDMLSALNGQDQVTKSCRFIVRIVPQGLLSNLSYFNDIGKTMIFACDAAEFPGRSFQATETRYYGPKQMTPNNTSYGDGITMGFLVRSKTFERQFFDDWMDIINPTTTFHFKYPSDYYCTIEVFHYAEYAKEGTGVGGAKVPSGIRPSASPAIKYQPEVIYGWKLNKAWPLMVAPQQVTWADTDILRMQVTFAYKYWERPGDREQIAKKITTTF